MYIVFGGHVHFHKYLLPTFNLKRNICVSILMRVPLSHPFNIGLYARMLTIMVAGIRGFLMYPWSCHLSLWVQWNGIWKLVLWFLLPRIPMFIHNIRISGRIHPTLSRISAHRYMRQVNYMPLISLTFYGIHINKLISWSHGKFH